MPKLTQRQRTMRTIARRNVRVRGVASTLFGLQAIGSTSAVAKARGEPDDSVFDAADYKDLIAGVAQQMLKDERNGVDREGEL